MILSVLCRSSFALRLAAVVAVSISAIFNPRLEAQVARPAALGGVVHLGLPQSVMRDYSGNASSLFPQQRGRDSTVRSSLPFTIGAVLVGAGVGAGAGYIIAGGACEGASCHASRGAVAGAGLGAFAGVLVAAIVHVRRHHDSP
jgi:hypothetical protein